MVSTCKSATLSVSPGVITFVADRLVLFHMPSRLAGKGSIMQREEELERVKQQHGIQSE